MAILLRIRKITETETHVEYELRDGSQTLSRTLVIAKTDHEAQFDSLTDSREQIGFAMAVGHFRRTGEWPATRVKQS